MNPVADWQQLSALYEAADALEPVPLAAWLAQLRAQAHPLLGQLEQMLAARAQVQRNGFLGSLPRMPVPAEPRVQAWTEGSRVGPYRLVRRLGEGGMAEVWMAQRDDGAFQRTVAIKLLFRNAHSSERDSFAQRFARERDILASLDHPHIAGLHDAGVTAAGQPWLALEYIEGETLTRWCDAQRLDIAARLRLFRQVLLAVQHAHANLVIHRDLKPGNILVTAQGEVRLLDFGIAKLMEPEGGALAETELTHLAGRPMTPQYAAPEQLLGQPLTTACDVYALGVVLYELLCGERPYELKLDSAAQLEQSILEVEPRGPSRRTLTDAAVRSRGSTPVALRKTLSSDLDAIVLRALAKQPAHRYGSAEAFRADLDHWLAGEPVEARVPSVAYRLSKFVRRHRWAVAFSAGAVLSLIGVTAVAVVMGSQAREDSARAGAARDFMLGLFKRADQEKARGADITARELLETGRKDVMTRLAGQPRLQGELLQGIGTIQRDMGEYVGADNTFAETSRVYLGLGMPREAAAALVEEANAAVRMGNIQLADRTLQQARAIANWPLENTELNARLTEIEGWIAIIKGDKERAKALFEDSYGQAIRIFGSGHKMAMDALSGRIYAEQQLGNFDRALELLEQLEAIVAKATEVDVRQLISLAIDRAELLQFAGRYKQVLEHVAVALPRCVSSLGPNHEDCRKLLVRKVNALIRMGMTDQANEERSLLQAVANDGKTPALGTEALLLVLKIDSNIASSELPVAAFDRVRALADASSGIVLSKSFRAKASLALAEAALRASDPERADRWIDAALLLQRREDGSIPISMLGALALSLKGTSLMQRGMTTEGLERLLRARDDFAKLIGPTHPTTEFCALNVVIALDALGRTKEARDMFAVAEEVLRGAVGIDAPMYRRIKQLGDRLERRTDTERVGGSKRAVTNSSVIRLPNASNDFFA